MWPLLMDFAMETDGLLYGRCVAVVAYLTYDVNPQVLNPALLSGLNTGSVCLYETLFSGNESRDKHVRLISVGVGNGTNIDLTFEFRETEHINILFTH